MKSKLLLCPIIFCFVMNLQADEAKTLKSLGAKQGIVEKGLKAKVVTNADNQSKLCGLKKSRKNEQQFKFNKIEAKNITFDETLKKIDKSKKTALDKTLFLLALIYCLYKVSEYGYNLYGMNIPYLHEYLSCSQFTEPGWLEWMMNGISQLCPSFLINGSRHIRLISFSLGTMVQVIAFKTAAQLVFFGARADIFDLYEKSIQQIKRTARITKDAILYS